MFTVCIQFHSTENPPGDKIHKSSQPAAPTPHSERKNKRKKKERYYLVKQEQEKENIDKSTWELSAFAWKLQKKLNKLTPSCDQTIPISRQKYSILSSSCCQSINCQQVTVNGFLSTTFYISNNIKKFREAILITKSLLNSSF